MSDSQSASSGKSSGVFDLFKEDNGKTSLMRIAVLIIILCIMIPYAVVSIQKGELQPLDIGSVSALIGALYVKSYQKEKEE